MIKLTRIDYRLLHGQVAFAWTNFLSADCILIANDVVAGDDFRKRTLTLAKPQGTKLIFKTIEDSVKAINSGVTDKYKLFVIVETIEDALKLATQVTQINKINLGLSNKKEDSKMIGKAVYVTEEEGKMLKELISRNITIEMKQAPQDTGVDVITLL